MAATPGEGHHHMHATTSALVMLHDPIWVTCICMCLTPPACDTAVGHVVAVMLQMFGMKHCLTCTVLWCNGLVACLQHGLSQNCFPHMYMHSSHTSPATHGSWAVLVDVLTARCCSLLHQSHVITAMLYQATASATEHKCVCPNTADSH